MGIERKRTFKEKASNILQAGVLAFGLSAGGAYVMDRFSDNRVYATNRHFSTLPLECGEGSLVAVSLSRQQGSIYSSKGIPEREITFRYANELDEQQIMTFTSSSEDGVFQKCFYREDEIVQAGEYTMDVEDTPFERFDTPDGYIYGCVDTCFTRNGVFFEEDGVLLPRRQLYNIYYERIGVVEPTSTPTWTPSPTPTETPVVTSTPEPTFTPTPIPSPELCDARVNVTGYVEGKFGGQGISAVAGFGVAAETTEGIVDSKALDDYGSASLVIPDIGNSETKPVTVTFAVGEFYLPEPSRVVRARCEEPVEVQVGFDEREIDIQPYEMRLPLITR